MLKGLALTPPTVGRISIGKVVVANGKRLPEKDDEFTITTQVQLRDGWMLHPLDEALRKAQPISAPRDKTKPTRIAASATCSTSSCAPSPSGCSSTIPT